MMDNEKMQEYKLDINEVEQYISRANMFHIEDGFVDKKGIFRRKNGFVILNLHQYIRMFREEIKSNDVVEIPDFVNIIIKTNSSVDDLSNKHIIFPSELILIATAKEIEEIGIDVKYLYTTFAEWNVLFENSILDFSKCYRMSKISFQGSYIKHINSIYLNENIKSIDRLKLSKRLAYYKNQNDKSIMLIDNLYGPGVEKLCPDVFEDIKIKRCILPRLKKFYTDSLVADCIVDTIVLDDTSFVQKGSINPDCINNLYIPIFWFYLSDNDIENYKNILSLPENRNAVVLSRTLNKIESELNKLCQFYVRESDVNMEDYNLISYLYVQHKSSYFAKLCSIFSFKEKPNVNKEPMNIYLYNFNNKSDLGTRNYIKINEIKHPYSQKTVGYVWGEE